MIGVNMSEDLEPTVPLIDTGLAKFESYIDNVPIIINAVPERINM